MYFKQIVIVGMLLSSTANFCMQSKRNFTQALKAKTCSQCRSNQDGTICPHCHPNTAKNSMVKKQRLAHNPSEN